VGDLARWNRALATGGVVSAESYRIMTTPMGAPAVGAKYGFGLERDSIAGHLAIAHDGGINGFVTSNAWIPDAELSVTVLTNASNGAPDRLLAQVVRAALGIPLVQRPKRVTLRQEELTPYVGTYALNLGERTIDFTVTAANGTLYGKFGGGNALPLIPYGHDVFGADFDETLRLTFIVENGRATRLTLAQNGGHAQGVRR
jgi:hypothetical protein